MNKDLYYFKECSRCASLPGTPALCESCLHNRDVITSLCAMVQGQKRNIKELQEPAPVRLLLFCPACKHRHIDEGEWASRPHRTHECQHCGFRWQPSNAPTVGVLFLEPDE